MRIYPYILTLIFSFFFSLAAFLGILFFVNPFEADGAQLFLFYITLFLTLISFFTLAGVAARKFFSAYKVQKKEMKTSLRQGFFFAFILVLFLFLEARAGLNWWKVTLPILLVAVCEYYFGHRVQ